MGLPIGSLAAGSSLADADLFEISQSGVSTKLTAAQLRALLLPSPALYSGLSAVATLGDSDLLSVEQSGVIMKLTKLQLIEFLDLGFMTVDQNVIKQDGDVVPYDGANFVTGATPRWRVIHQNAYTEAAPASFTTITFAGGGPTGGIYLKATDYFSVGTPVRVVIAGVAHYGICHAVTDTLLTIAGANLSITTITSVSVGSPDMVKHVTMRYEGTGYNSSTTLVLKKGCQHRWQGPTGYLCAFSCAHIGSAAGTVVQLQMNGGASVNGSAGVIPAAGTASTYGAFVDDTANRQIVNSLCAIAHGQTITAKTTTIGASADYLIICMTFVVP